MTRTLPQLQPLDAHNATLARHVAPPDWTNPDPAPLYNLVVIGGGPAGLVAAAGAAGLGARVALVERDLLGGDCLNVGCVPSKALLRCARAAHEARRAGEFGLPVSTARPDFGAVMERVRRLRAGLAAHDSAHRFRSLGVDVFLGEARFGGVDRVVVGERVLAFRRAIIATGARPAVPPIPGLAESGFLTNVTLFSLTALPPRLAVIGGGPIGCEMAQAFARLGARVTLVEAAGRVLPRDEPDAASRLQEALTREGVDLRLATKVIGVSRRDGVRALTLEHRGAVSTLEADEVLVAVGRVPNVESLGLGAAGVAYDARGIQVDDRLRTSNRRVYAAGDVCSRFQFTHAADAMARLALRNALFFGCGSAGSLVIPWCTYTDPEIAHVGIAPGDSSEVVSHTVEFADIDRAVLDGETDGFARIHVARRRGRILGATIVGHRAGELIGIVAHAIASGASIGELGRSVLPYPTLGSFLTRLADAHARTRLTPRVASLLRRYLRWLR